MKRIGLRTRSAPSRRLQLWSYNYSPEPTGIAPVSATWAKAMQDLGHEVEVVAAFPHYPEPVWRHPRRPYRERIDGVLVYRLPIWVGRSTTSERLRQEASYALAQFVSAPFLSRPDVMVVVSPSFPALAPAMVNARMRRIPWVLWLQDVLPDGALATGLMEPSSPVFRAAQRLERAAYAAATRIVVPSRSFVRNLAAKRVTGEKVDVIYNPSTRTPADRSTRFQGNHKQLLTIGNIGHSQGLAEVVRSFESQPDQNRGTELLITGSGVAVEDVRREVRTGRVKLLGLLDSDRLEDRLHSATAGLVSQRPSGTEFNIPSKLMNFMAYGLPVIAAVDPDSEVAALVNESEAGWVLDARRLLEFPRRLAGLLADADELERRGDLGRRYAESHFSARGLAARFEQTLDRAAPYA